VAQEKEVGGTNFLQFGSLSLSVSLEKGNILGAPAKKRKGKSIKKILKGGK